MNLFNKKYHIQIQLCKLQLGKKKKKKWGAREISIKRLVVNIYKF